jgi:hypothetical protein
VPQEPIREFVFAPLPRGIANLADKFPRLAQTLEEVGISSLSDVQKLQSTRLALPGLSQLSGETPTEVVFTRGGAQLIDIPAFLTVNDQSQAQQRISTIAGKPLHLSVRPEGAARSVRGYLVFRSSSPRASQGIEQNALFASAFFASPVLAQAQTQPINIETELVLLEFEYEDPDQDGLYTADIQAPVVEGEYEVITIIEYEDPELGTRALRLITIIDPEGYIFERTGGKEARIPGAIVSLYWFNPDTDTYELWPAEDYQQENPQITDATGRYSFLVPQGSYFLQVEAPGYPIFQGKVFQVREGTGVHENVELRPTYWYLTILDWKVFLLFLFGILLLYNFYRDRMRGKADNVNRR